MTRVPQTDSVEELARFWDTHDVTEFEDELQEVPAPVFIREGQTVVKVPLDHDEAAALRLLAQSIGMKDIDLIKQWVSEKLRAS